jgi:hypothetical protein
LISQYYVECSYGDCNEVVSDEGRSFNFQGKTVVVKTQCTLATPLPKQSSWVKLVVLKNGEQIPPTASEKTIILLNNWYEAGRFKEG